MAKKETPLMGQYNSIKSKYPDAILLFRVGDFYETFGADAIECARVLDIVQTKRANGSASHIELAGFPYHALDTYLPKLVKAGKRVAICEQLEEASQGKKIVKRGVTELVTPGVVTNAGVLQQKSNNYLAAIAYNKSTIGISFLDVSTGEFLVAEGDEEYIQKLIANFSPNEIIYNRQQKKLIHENYQKYYLYPIDDWAFYYQTAEEKIKSQFKTNSIKGFGIDHFEVGVCAAGAILSYLDITHTNARQHLQELKRIDVSDFVWMDSFTISNLELIYPSHPQGKSVLDVVDYTISPMGGRLLKKWVLMPLVDQNNISRRHEIVSCFLEKKELKTDIENHLANCGDLERLSAKLGNGKISPKEIIHLKNSLQSIAQIKNSFKGTNLDIFKSYVDILNDFEELIGKISSVFIEDAPVSILKGDYIAEGVSEQLDEYKNVKNNSKSLLNDLVETKKEETGISSLKLGSNSVFGYFLEVRNTYKDQVPEEWHRKQTLVNAERYIIEELKVLETKIFEASDEVQKLELDIYNNFITEVQQYIGVIQLNAQKIAEIDCLLGFSTLASKHKYHKPVLKEEKGINIIGGRHPVIERGLPVQEKYIPNDLSLQDISQQIIMVTGPNMSGKSAFLRQNALIILLGQMGSFVPAQSAEFSIVDKIFTRVGASDNISSGESTFMVEMNETARIMNNLSKGSLIILDEIGRGTSTFDGISIAWSIAEFLHKSPLKPLTLFATHYHELNEMEEQFDRIKNHTLSIKEINGKIHFLRKLVAGGSNHSFGIHVAELAGMPKAIIKRSQQILDQLEKGNTAKSSNTVLKTKNDDMQLSFFQLDDPVLLDIRDQIVDIDIDTLTPVEALMKLNEIKNILGK